MAKKKKNQIKRRKQLVQDYRDRGYPEYHTLDAFDSIQKYLGNLLTEDMLLSAITRVREVREQNTYSGIEFIFCEPVMKNHRPRDRRFGGKMTPNADDNKKAFSHLLKDIMYTKNIIANTMKIEVEAYLPMPASAHPVDVCIYETKHDYATSTPDGDNIFKAYSDMIVQKVILDDAYVSVLNVTKYYSVSPKLVMRIVYPDYISTKYLYDSIRKTKSFKDLQDNINLELIGPPYPRKIRRKD